MTDIAKIFTNGRSQAVRLPKAYRFEVNEVYIHRDPLTGDVILSPKPDNWDGFITLLNETTLPDDFLSEPEVQSDEHRDPFAGWKEE